MNEEPSFKVTINRERAEAFLACEDCCQSEGQGGDMSWMYPGIEAAFPELKERYRYLWPDG